MRAFTPLFDPVLEVFDGDSGAAAVLIELSGLFKGGLHFAGVFPCLNENPLRSHLPTRTSSVQHDQDNKSTSQKASKQQIHAVTYVAAKLSDIIIGIVCLQSFR